jgi:two-component system, NtrC family, response regulator AtoC
VTPPLDSAQPWTVTVAFGTRVGAKLELEDGRRYTVGRSRDADLFLDDVTVSRQHLELSAAADGVLVRALAGAQPFIHGNRTTAEATVRVGEHIAIGKTVLSFALRQAAASEPAASIAASPNTSATGLLSGVGGAVRGLAAVFALSEALDGVTDPATVADTVSQWARLYTSAESVTLSQRPDASHETESKDRTVAIPLHGLTHETLLFRLTSADVDETTERLLVVATRMCASTLLRLRALHAVREDAELLRVQAVGSARGFLGGSPAAQRVANLLPRIAAADSVVLLLGESGSGKTFLARLLHESGPRAGKPLRVINCAAIPENLVESELFGHERGAFTGAVAARAGVLESAADGTVLLDEIGELPLASQAKLLRVLEDKSFERVGSNRQLTLRARVIAATNRDLREMIKLRQFREDLFFRISVFNIRVPPLRERGEDVVLIAQQMLRDLSASGGRRIEGFSPEALAALKHYPWPGNVRELRNALEHALLVGDEPFVLLADLPEAMHGELQGQSRHFVSDASDVVQLPANLHWLERQSIEAALRATTGNRTHAAALLGISRVTLHKKIRQYEEEPSGGGGPNQSSG